MSTRQSHESYRFGPYRVDASTGLLWKGSVPVPLTPKASELLLLLVRHGEAGITKSELLERLWPDTVVLDNNLTVTMSALRKALGESAANPRYIQTLPRRGYRFVPSAAPEPEESAAEPAPSERRPRPKLGALAEQALAQSDASCAALFVGRAAELAALEREWRSARSGSGRVICVSGEPGIGKTTLIERFRSTLGASAAGPLVARGRCLETFGSGEAYWPFLEVLDALLAGAEGARVRAALRTHAPTWYVQFPGSIESGEASRLTRETLGATQQRMLRELTDAFVALARDCPLVLVLEDLHWADPSSIDLLRALCHKARAQPWLVLATFRAAEAAHNAPLAAFRRELVPREAAELALEPLGEAQVRSYLGTRFAGGALPAELSRFLLERTEGHPLFLTRLVSLLVERGDICERGGAWRLRKPLCELSVSAPADVASVLSRQLERLSPEDRRALTYASVEGEEFSSAVLAALLEEDELSLQERMAELDQTHHLIRTLGEEQWPDGHVCVRYRFSHALYQAVLYDKLVSARRVQLHLRAAEVLVRHFGEGAPLVAVTLARHFEIGADVESAVRYLLVSATRAHQLLAHREAREHYCRAALLIARLPVAARAAAAVQVHVGRGWVDFDTRSGDFGRADFDAGCRYAESGADPALLCKALFAASVLAYFEFRLDDSRALDERLSSVARASGDPELIALAQISLAAGYVVDGKVDEAMCLHRDAWAGAEQASEPNLLAMLHFDRGRCRRLRSDYAGALASFESSLALWLGVSGVMAITNYQEIARAHANLGQFCAALGAYEKAAELARLNGQEHRLREQPSRVGWIRRELGDVEGAIAEDERALAGARAQGAAFSELSHLIDLALDHLEAGGVAVAEELLGAAQRGLSAGNVPAFPIDLLGVRLRWLEAQSRVQLAKGELLEARRSATELLTEASRLPWPKYVALAHAELGRVSRAEGDAAQARRELLAALDILAAHAVPIVTWKVYAELGSLDQSNGNAGAAREALRAAANDASFELDSTASWRV